MKIHYQVNKVLKYWKEQKIYEILQQKKKYRNQLLTINLDLIEPEALVIVNSPCLLCFLGNK